jgi:hypothetical protein
MFIVSWAKVRERVSRALDLRLRARAPTAALAGSLAVTSLLWVSANTPATAAQGQTRLFVAVHDNAGAPVVDLTASDFLIRIDGVDQELVSVTRATTPLSIVILTDALGLTSMYPMRDLREGLAGFVAAIRAGSSDAKFGLLTIDGSPNLRARIDSTPAILDREMARLVGVAPSSVILDGVHQAAGLLARAPTERRAILNLFAAYRPDLSSLRTDEVGRALRQSGASLWSIEVVANTGWQVAQGPNRPTASPGTNLGVPVQIAPDPTQPSSGAYASQPREFLISEGGVRSGGLRLTVTSPLQLAPALQKVSQLLLSQYEIVYGPARATAQSQRLVAVRRQNVTVLAPSWVSR